MPLLQSFVNTLLVLGGKKPRELVSIVLEP